MVHIILFTIYSMVLFWYYLVHLLGCLFRLGLHRHLFSFANSDVIIIRVFFSLFLLHEIVWYLGMLGIISYGLYMSVNY